MKNTPENKPHKQEDLVDNTEKIHHNKNVDISENLDTIAFYLFQAITRKSNQQLQKEGA